MKRIDTEADYEELVEVVQLGYSFLLFDAENNDILTVDGLNDFDMLMGVVSEVHCRIIEAYKIKDSRIIFGFFTIKKDAIVDRNCYLVESTEDLKDCIDRIVTNINFKAQKSLDKALAEAYSLLPSVTDIEHYVDYPGGKR